MARRMVVVPEEFLKMFKQEPQIPLNILRNDELLADRLNKALHQRTLFSERKTASTQTSPSDHNVDQLPKDPTSPVGINQTLPTPSVPFPPRAPEQQSTPVVEEFESFSEATPPKSQERSIYKQRQKTLKIKLRNAGAWDQATKEIYKFEGGQIENSNIDDVLSYAFDVEGREPPLGYEEIARRLKIMDQSGFPNKHFQRTIDQSREKSPRRRTKIGVQRGKGKCCKKLSKDVEPLRWTPY